MEKSRYTEEQITYALRQADAGTPVADVCRQMGISEASFYVWKKKYGQLKATEFDRKWLTPSLDSLHWLDMGAAA